MRVGVVGAAGYIGGELARLALGHPELELVQVTSDTHAGKPLHATHPNLRGVSDLVFTEHDALERMDAAFVALSNGGSSARLDALEARSDILIDLSADFRLRDPDLHARHYPPRGPVAERADAFVSGIPELRRDALRSATRISVPGCMATAAILALHPLAAEGLLGEGVFVDGREGSSGSGARPSEASHHPERSGATRVYKPTGHRHAAEIFEACGLKVRMTASGINTVRGVQVVVQGPTSTRIDQRTLWDAYRGRYRDEPFVRIVSEARGVHRLPDPAVLLGSNFCDVGFALSDEGDHVVAVAALDNLVKGGAGNAMQCLNIAAGFHETDGLAFAGLHPV